MWFNQSMYVCVCLCREIEGVAQMVDEDVEEGARDLMELNEDSTTMARKRARRES